MRAPFYVASAAVGAVLFACSSSTTPAGGDPTDAGGSTSSASSSSGTSGTTSSSSASSSSSTSSTGGVDAGFDGGFDFTFTGGGTDIKQTTFQVTPVYGAFCMGTPKVCSFTANITQVGCTYILNVAFVAPTLTNGTAFPVVTDPSTPPGDSTVNYTEICGSATKMWKGTGGTVTLDTDTPPAKGFSTGMSSFSVQSATMAAAPNGAGAATGTFTVSGKGLNVPYTLTN